MTVKANQLEKQNQLGGTTLTSTNTHLNPPKYPKRIPKSTERADPCVSNANNCVGENFPDVSGVNRPKAGTTLTPGFRVVRCG